MENFLKEFQMEVGALSKIDLVSRLFERGQGQLSDDHPDRIRIPELVMEMFKSLYFFTLEEPLKINLVRVNLKELGLKSGCSTEEVINCAEKLRYYPCPPEVAPLLRLNYKKIFGEYQKDGESLVIISNPILISDGYNFFDLSKMKGSPPWIGCVNSSGPWYDSEDMIFMSKQRLVLFRD
ncbi:hypothetical protein EOL99_02100 [Candidatus Falkowbacteria bacterium]|nr:hypothetical protein [Candidatus Falkowbacteria bacterium]